MWLNISKDTSCRKTRFWVMGMQSQNISKYSSKVDFEISHTLESSILNLQVTWRIWCKSSVFVSKLTSELPKYQYFVQISKFQEPFSQRQLFTNLLWHPQWICHISRTQCPISKLFAPKLRWKNSHLGNTKKSILISGDSWSLSMCWDTYICFFFMKSLTLQKFLNGVFKFKSVKASIA